MSRWVDRTFPSPTFPLHLDLGFQMAQLFVVNATAANVYLSRGSQSTPTAGADATIPPYTPLPVYNWGSDTVFVGSDGAPLRTTDTLTVYATDDPAASFPAVGIGQPNYYDKPNPIDYVFNGGDLSTLGTVSPLGVTTLATYTVPVNRKASIESISLMLIHQIAGAGNAGVDRVYVQTKPPNLAAATAALVALAAATVGADVASFGQSGYLNSGTVLTVGVQLASSGATVNYYASVRIKEFDA